MRFEGKLIENLVFGRSRLNSSIFEKHFISYSCILFIIQCALRSFCIKMLCFSKKQIFLDFRSIEVVARPIEIAIKNFGFNLPDSIQFLSIWPIFFFHASFMFRIHMHCIDFLHSSCSFAVISLIVFTQHAYTLLNWVLNLI